LAAVTTVFACSDDSYNLWLAATLCFTHVWQVW
jgi:hypothetical protein